MVALVGCVATRSLAALGCAPLLLAYPGRTLAAQAAAAPPGCVGAPPGLCPLAGWQRLPFLFPRSSCNKASFSRPLSAMFLCVLVVLLLFAVVPSAVLRCRGVSQVQECCAAQCRGNARANARRGCRELWFQCCSALGRGQSPGVRQHARRTRCLQTVTGLHVVG